MILSILVISISLYGQPIDRIYYNDDNSITFSANYDFYTIPADKIPELIEIFKKIDAVDEYLHNTKRTISNKNIDSLYVVNIKNNWKETKYYDTIIIPNHNKNITYDSGHGKFRYRKIGNDTYVKQVWKHDVIIDSIKYVFG